MRQRQGQAGGGRDGRDSTLCRVPAPTPAPTLRVPYRPPPTTTHTPTTHAQVERGSDGFAAVKHVSSLTAHLSTVNCVRVSPTGRHLASSGDGGEVLLWEPAGGGGDASAAPQPPRGNLCEDEGEATWRRSAAFKGHAATSDVMDLSWSADGAALASGAIDSEVILFSAGPGKRRGEQAVRFKNHKHFVQGLAWDPAQQYVVTQSADRTCRWVGGGGWWGGRPAGIWASSFFNVAGRHAGWQSAAGDEWMGTA